MSFFGLGGLIAFAMMRLMNNTGASLNHLCPQAADRDAGSSATLLVTVCLVRHRQDRWPTANYAARHRARGRAAPSESSARAMAGAVSGPGYKFPDGTWSYLSILLTRLTLARPQITERSLVPAMTPSLAVPQKDRRDGQMSVADRVCNVRNEWSGTNCPARRRLPAGEAQAATAATETECCRA